MGRGVRRQPGIDLHSSVLQLDTSDDDDVDIIGVSARRHTDRVPTDAPSIATANGRPSANGAAGMLKVSIPCTMSGMMTRTLSFFNVPCCMPVCMSYELQSIGCRQVGKSMQPFTCTCGIRHCLATGSALSVRRSDSLACPGDGGALSLGTALTYMCALQEACGARMRVCSAARGGAGPGALQLACTRI